MKKKLLINEKKLNEFNKLLTMESNPLIDKIITVIEKYNGVDAIKQKHQQTAGFDYKLSKLKETNSIYLQDLQWLIEQKNTNAFISMEDYKKKILADQYDSTTFSNDYAVTLEISALQYFPWLISQAKNCIDNKELMPGRFIRVRNMQEQENDDLIAVSAAIDIVGATLVETLDTKGTDGSNIHLGGPDTITGYFTGIGQPNDYPVKWLDEYLYYHTNYGVKQVLNINPGTVLAAFLLYKLGVDIQFKISVFMGNDNPFSMLWILMMANFLSRDDNSTPLVGFNFSNAVKNETIEQCSFIRKELGLEDKVRFEHHITEAYKHIVLQPYDRTEELVEVCKNVKNISAKHEGGKPELDKTRDHPSDILDYFLNKDDAVKDDLMPKLQQNYLDKHAALNQTAIRLIETGTPVIAAWNLHN